MAECPVSCEYSLTLLEEIHELERDFSCIIDNLLKSLNSVSDLKVLLFPHLRDRYPAIMSAQAEQLSKETSVKGIINILRLYYGFLNPSLFNFITENVSGKDLKLQMNKYLRKIENFRSKTKLFEFGKQWEGVTPTGYKEITLEMSEQWRDSTLYDLERFCNKDGRENWIIKSAIPESTTVIFSIPNTWDTSLLKDWMPDVNKYYLDEEVFELLQDHTPNEDSLNGLSSLSICYKDGIESEDRNVKNGSLSTLQSDTDEDQRVLLNNSFTQDQLEKVSATVLQLHGGPMKDSYKYTLLHLAAMNGELDSIRYFIECLNCNPNSKGFKRRVLLHHACENGFLDVVKYLVDTYHSNPLYPDEDQATPLHLASANGHLHIVKYFTLLCHCDPLVKDSNRNTPLHYATMNGKLEVVKFLTEDLNCDANTSGRCERIPLHHASKNGHLDVVKYLVDKHHCNPLCPDKDKTTPLHRASANGHLEIVRYFTTDLHCNPLVKNVSDNAPLHLAAANGKLDVIKFFLEELNCDRNSQGRWGRKILHYASESGHLGLTRYLSSRHYCDPLCQDEEQETPLHRASANGHLHIVKYFTLVHHSHPHVKNAYGNTPLHNAALNGKLDVVKFFIEDLNCDVNSKGQWGRISLHHASQNGHLDIVKYLVEVCNCDPLCRDEDHETPLHLAAFHGHLDTVKYFIIDHECDPFITTVSGHTAESKASLNGQDRIVSFLHRTLNYQPLKLFVMGNSGSGKSTLVKALSSQDRGKVKGVLPLTAGIVPTSFYSKVFGKVYLYDFAGHEEYYASHEMILQQTPQPLVLITVNMSLSTGEIEKQLLYWLSILSNAALHTSCKTIHLITVASFSDLVQSDSKLQIERFITSVTLINQANITYHGFIQCDCRYSTSIEMNQLRQKLYTVCKLIRINIAHLASDHFDNLCTSLMDYFQHNLSNQVKTITIGGLNIQIKLLKSPGPALVQLKDEKILVQTCEKLSTNGYLLFLHYDHDVKKSLLVLDEKTLLSKVHACLKEIKQSITNDIGMLEESKLKEVLSTLLEGEMEPDLAIKYMIFTQFCTKVTPDQLATVPENLKGVTHYFFPNLVRAQRPSYLWITEENYTQLYTWCLKCTNHQFFTPRYLHTLFIQLVKCESETELAKCTIWKNGILLVSPNLTRCVIEVTDQTTHLYLVLQCMKGHELYLVEHRSMLISLIKSLMSIVCPKLEPKEVLLCPQISYPPANRTEIAIADMACSVLGSFPAIICEGNRRQSPKPVLISDLVIFDSFHAIQEPVLEQIFLNSKSDKIVSTAIVNDVCEAVRPFLKLDKVLKNKGKHFELTYRQLHQELSKYSIFTEGNIYELAGVELTLIRSDDEISNQYFDCNPLTIKDLFEVNVKLTFIVEWREFGLALNLKASTLDKIRSNCHQNVQHCLTETLAAWLKEEDRPHDSPPPHWGEVIDALKSPSVNMREDAENLAKIITGTTADPIEHFSSVDSSQLDPNCISTILKYVHTLMPKWFYLGLSLGLRYSTLKYIEASHHLSIDNHMTDMLRKWLDGVDQGNGRSWRSLALALDCPLVCEHQVACSIRDEHQIA